jgi:hypothetical protein
MSAIQHHADQPIRISLVPVAPHRSGCLRSHPPVQVLHAKMVSTGAQKGMLFSIAGFQAGAVEYATVHSIALIHMARGSSTWLRAYLGRPVARQAIMPQTK